MNTELKEINNLDFDFKKTPPIKKPEIKPKKSFKKLITVCMLGLFLGSGYYGYNKVDNFLNPAHHVLQHKWLFAEYTSITPEEQKKIDNIYSGKYKNKYVSIIESVRPTYYFNNLSDIRKAYEILELNKGINSDYEIEKDAIKKGESYFNDLLQDKIKSELLQGKSPKELSIAKFINPEILEKYQSIYEEIKPQFIQSDISGDIRYKLNKEYIFPDIKNTTYSPKDMSVEVMAIFLLKDTGAFATNSKVNLKLWD